MKFTGVMIGTENSKSLADFYTKILGEPTWHDGDWYGYGRGEVVIGFHSEVKGQNSTPARLMLLFEVNDVAAEFARIKDLGATVVAEPYHPGESKDMTLATLADPDGNYFQLSTPWKD